MSISIFSNRTESLNAKVAAVTLAVAAFMTLLLSHFSVALAPIRLLTFATAAFGVWAFCDEMGIAKPLNRAGFVFFAIAALAKIQLFLGITNQFIGRYYLLYSAFLLLAVLFWSVALLHRQRSLKTVGAIGVAASLLPTAAIVVGHLVLGIGAAIGLEAILSATEVNDTTDLSFVILVERIFGLWAYVVAWFLWKGYIKIKNA